MPDIATTTAATEILSWISQYGYIVILPLFILEGASMGFIAGVLVSLGALEPVPVFILYVSGTIITDSILYQLARSGSTVLQRIPFARRALERLNYSGQDKSLQPPWVSKFYKHYFPLMFLAKLSPIPAGSQVVAIVAGVIKLPRKRFYPPIIIGQPIWSAAVIATGYYFGDTAQHPQKLLSEAGVFTIIAIAIGLLYYHYLHDRFKAEFNRLLVFRDNNAKT
jgi:membrane protein DedA with SNARE-associated domain